jgi:hypothetical protein
MIIKVFVIRRCGLIINVLIQSRQQLPTRRNALLQPSQWANCLSVQRKGVPVFVFRLAGLITSSPVRTCTVLGSAPAMANWTRSLRTGRRRRKQRADTVVCSDVPGSNWQCQRITERHCPRNSYHTNCGQREQRRDGYTKASSIHA